MQTRSDLRLHLMSGIHTINLRDAKAHALFLALLFVERNGDYLNPTLDGKHVMRLSMEEVGRLVGGSRSGGQDRATPKAIRAWTRHLVDADVIEHVEGSGHGYGTWRIKDYAFDNPAPSGWNDAPAFVEALIKQRATSPFDRVLLSRLAWASNYDGVIEGTRLDLASKVRMDGGKVLDTLRELALKPNHGVVEFATDDSQKQHRYCVTLEIPLLPERRIFLDPIEPLRMIEEAEHAIARTRARSVVEESRTKSVTTLEVAPAGVAEAVEDDVIEAAFDVSTAAAPGPAPSATTDDSIDTLDEEDVVGLTISADGIEAKRKPEMTLALAEPVRPKARIIERLAPKPIAATDDGVTPPGMGKAAEPKRLEAQAWRQLAGADSLDELEEDIAAACDAAVLGPMPVERRVGRCGPS